MIPRNTIQYALKKSSIAATEKRIKLLNREDLIWVRLECPPSLQPLGSWDHLEYCQICLPPAECKHKFIRPAARQGKQKILRIKGCWESCLWHYQCHGQVFAKGGYNFLHPPKNIFFPLLDCWNSTFHFTRQSIPLTACAIEIFSGSQTCSKKNSTSWKERLDFMNISTKWVPTVPSMRDTSNPSNIGVFAKFLSGRTGQIYVSSFVAYVGLEMSEISDPTKMMMTLL